MIQYHYSNKIKLIICNFNNFANIFLPSHEKHGNIFGNQEKKLRVSQYIITQIQIHPKINLKEIYVLKVLR